MEGPQETRDAFLKKEKERRREEKTGAVIEKSV